MQTIAELRKANGGLGNLSDEQIVQSTYPDYQRYFSSQDDYAAAVGYAGAGRGLTGSRISAGVDNYQSNLYGTVGAVARGVGLPSGVSDFADRGRDNNKSAADYAQARAKELGGVDDFRNVSGVGSGLNYLGGLAAQSLPYLGEAAVGGITGGLSLPGTAARMGLSAGAARTAARTAGATAAGYPSAVGDILSNQREENGTENLSAALAGGVPYALLNAGLGVEGRLARGALARNSTRVLDDLTDMTGFAARTGATAGKVALGEGLSETGQELINQSFGRMAVNPNQTLFNEEANKRYLDSFIGGAALGGAFGAVGGSRRSAGYVDPNAPTNLLGPDAPPDALRNIIAADPGGTQAQINRRLGIDTQRYAGKDYAKQFEAAAAEPTGQRVVNADGIELPDSALDNVQRQAGILIEQRQRAQAIKAQADEVAASVEARKQRAADVGLDPKKGAVFNLFGQLEDAHNDGDITDGQLAENLGMLKASQLGNVRSFLKGMAAQNAAATQSAAANEQTALDALQPKAANAPTASDTTTTTTPASVAAAPNLAVQPGANAPAATATPAPAAPGASAAPLNAQPAATAAPVPVKPAASSNPPATAAQRAAAALKAVGIPPDRQIEVPRNGKVVNETALSLWTNLTNNPKALRRAQQAMGADAQWNVVNSPMSFADIGAAEGTSRQAVTKQMLGFGIKETTVDAAVASDGNMASRVGVGVEEESNETGATAVPKSSDDTLQAAPANNTGTEGDADYTGGAGYRVESTPAKAMGEGLVEGAAETNAQRAARLRANDLLKINKDLDRAVVAKSAEDTRQELENQRRADAQYAAVLKSPQAQPAMVDWNDGKQEGSPSYQELVPRARQAWVWAHLEFTQENGNDWGKLQAFIQKFEKDLDESDYQKISSNDAVSSRTTSVLEPAPAAVAASTTGVRADSAPVQSGGSRQAASGSTSQPTVTVKKRRTIERSDAPDSRGRSDAGQLRSELAKFIRVDALGRSVVVVQSMQDLPMGAVGAKSLGVNGDTQAFVLGNQAFLIADNIAPGRGKAVFMHEVGSHLGLQNMLTQGEFKGLVRTLLGWMEGKAGPEAQALARRALGRVQSADTPESQYSIELVAYTIEEAIAAGYNPMAAGNEGPIKAFMRSVMQMFKALVTKLGLKPETFTVQDLVDMAYGAAQAVPGVDVNATRGGGVTDTPAFKKWFGDSKVVNADGQPLVVYHGAAKPITEFSNEKGRSLALSDDAQGFYFSDSPDAASGYGSNAAYKADPVGRSGAAVYPVYLSMQNPDIRIGSQSNNFSHTYISPKERAALEAAGFDGVIYKDPKDSFFNEYIVFGPTQIKSATGNNGDFDPANARIDKSTRAQFSQAASPPVAKSHSAIASAFKEALATTGEAGSSLLKKAVFTQDLIDMAAKVLPAAKAYLANVNAVNTEKLKLAQAVQNVVADFRALTAVEQGQGPLSVNIFLLDSTSRKAWGYAPAGKPNTVLDPALAARYKLMDPAAQAVIAKVFAHGEVVRKQLMDANTATVNREFAADIAAAQAKGYAAEVAKLTADRARALKDVGKGLAGDWPYTPLSRFGDHVVLGTSARYMAAVKAGDKAGAAALQSDANHYHVDRTDSMRSARQLADTLRARFPGGHVTSFERGPENDVVYGGRDALGVLTRLRNLVRNSAQDDPGLDQRANATIDKNLRNLHLQLLSETSARKSQLGRVTVAGANKDMMRSFAGHGQAMAHYIATLRMDGAVQDSLDSMKGQAEAHTPGDTERRAYFNEILRRHVQNLNYEPNATVEKIMAASSVWSLLTNPAYHLMNSLQTVMVSLPQMAGKHGYARAASTLTAAYRDLGPIVRGGSFKESDFGKLPKDVQAMAKALAARGSIGIAQDVELGSFESPIDGKTHVFSTVVDKLRGVTEGVEAVNRLSTAIAAYRLERTRGATEQAATDYAHQVVYDTHGDYLGFNAPRFMRAGLGRIATQFKKFQLIQLTLYTKLLQQSFKGASPEERAIAQKTLAFNLSHLFVLGGALALPGFNTIAWILGKAFGDDDTPDDAEATLRRLIKDKPLADMLLLGLPKLGGVGISTRLGMGDILSVVPYAEPDLSRKGYESALLGLAGPFVGGLLPRAFDGLGLMNQSFKNGQAVDFYKGLEQLMPNGMGNLMKAARYQVGGISQRNGDVVIKPEDLSVLDSMAQAFGLPTNTVTDRNFLSQSLYKAKDFYKERGAQIKRSYVEAYKTNDAETLNDARGRWQDMQAAMREQGYAVQPLSSLLKAPMEAAKRERNTLAGVEVNKRTRGAVELLEQ